MIDQVFAQAEELRARGWRFCLSSGKNGWQCTVAGAGLAYATGYGGSIVEALADAMKRALATEDDPKTVLSRHEAWIKEAVAGLFGKDALLGIDIGPDPDQEWPHPHNIVLRILYLDPDVFVKQEGKFYSLLVDKPDEIRSTLCIRAIPEAAVANQPGWLSQRQKGDT